MCVYICVCIIYIYLFFFSRNAEEFQRANHSRSIFIYKYDVTFATSLMRLAYINWTGGWVSVGTFFNLRIYVCAAAETGWRSVDTSAVRDYRRNT